MKQVKNKGHFMAAWLVTLLPFLFCMISDTHAQKLGFDETLSYINSKLGGSIKVTVDRGIVVSSYFENGKLYRDDHMNPRDIDTNKIFYDAAENLFCLNCQGGKNKCVDRNIYVNKISRGYSRMSFMVTLNGKSAAGLRKAFIHLIKLCTQHNYKNNEPFE